MMLALSGGTSAAAMARRVPRGPRAGSARGGRKLGLKLKRLDSGDYVPRGGGRGSRGSNLNFRGRKAPGAYGVSGNEYFMQQYMQGSSPDLTSPSKYNVSPGSTPIHDDSETSSLASLDEQFYTE